MIKKLVSSCMLLLTTMPVTFAVAPPDFQKKYNHLNSPFEIWKQYGAPNMNMFFNYYIAVLSGIVIFRLIAWNIKRSRVDPEDRGEIKLVNKTFEKILAAWVFGLFFKVILVFVMKLFGVDLDWFFGGGFIL